MKKKKKLSHNQKRRIQDNKNKKLSFSESDVSIEQMHEPESAIVISRFGQHAEVQSENNQFYKCQIRRSIESLVTGDHVLFRRSKTDSLGIIEAVKPRKTTLTRPDYFDGIKIVAANIDQICIVSSIEPAFSSQIIDRYLIAAEHAQIPPIIILNKTDLYQKLDFEFLKNQIQPYIELDYKILWLSREDTESLEKLGECIKNKTSILVGQSGVGKSSLINGFLPEAKLEEGAVSTRSSLGQHTTTTSKRLQLTCGGAIIDSPGIREFGLWNFQTSEIAWYFKEFRTFINQCRFKDCQHIKDPGCALKQAVESGKVHTQRYQNYLKIVSSVQEGKDNRRMKKSN